MGSVGPDIRMSKKRKLLRFSEEQGARGPSILDTPNEVILAILEEVPDNGLVAMAGACRRVRPLSILVYLRRLRILSSELGSQEMQLCRNVPAAVFLLLSSVHLTDKVNLTCDVFYLLEYEAALQDFIVRTKIVSISLQIYSHEPAVMLAPRTACALRSFLGSLSIQCQSITVENLRFCAFTPRQVTQSEAHLGSNAYNAGIKILMSNVRTMVLTDDLFETSSLAKIGSLLLDGPRIKNFGLTCMSAQRNRSNSILLQVKFPALRYLRVSSTVIPQIPTDFFRRHSSLYALALFGKYTGMPQQPLARTSKSSSRAVELPGLKFLTFSDRFLPWVSTLLCPDLNNVTIYPTRYWEKGRMIESWKGLRTCFDAIIQRGMSGDNLMISIPHGDKTVECEASRIHNQFAEARKTGYPVLKTSRLAFQLYDLSNESLVSIVHIFRHILGLTVIVS
ncbi:hypothetical protein Hypma_010167 [Hypsizygus marmoreus]|uniref:F-box domain-containing protein n=1 Tax=Hypsizygus marmoreus TaxID=39966 RepID=A0A369JSP4_HYPMA|nr:hypothetical protein Hypma_010167 [Hypsizygus marmoreus]